MASASTQHRPSNGSPSGARLVLQGDRIVAISKPALSIFQCKREDLLGQSLLSLSEPIQADGSDSSSSLNSIVSAAMAGDPQPFDWLVRRSDGVSVSLQATMDQMQAHGRNFVEISVLDTQIHDTGKLTPSRFRLGIERSNDAVFMTDKEGLIIYTNPAFEKIYGYSSEEAIGQTPRILKSGKLSAEEYKAIWDTLLNKEVVSGEIINKTKDGQLIHIEGSNNPILDERGEIVGFLGIHRDISQRKEAESVVKEVQEELEQRVESRTAELSEALALLREQFAELNQIQGELERRNQILEALNELAVLTSSSLELTPIFNSILEITSQLIDATSAYVSEIDLDADTVTVVAEYTGAQAKSAELLSDLGQSYNLASDFQTFRGFLLGQVEPFVVHIDDPSLTEAELEHMESHGAKSILGIPLWVQGQPVAEVEFWESRRRREFTREEIDLVQAIAHQAAVPIENARLYAQSNRELDERRQLEERIRASLERRGRQVRLSSQLTRVIATAVDLSDLYQRVVTQLKEQFGFYHVQVLRYEPAVNAVVLIAGYGQVGKDMLDAGYQLPADQGLIGHAAVRGQSILRPDVSDDPDWLAHALLPDTKGELAVPIIVGEEVLGILDVQSDQAGELSEEDQIVLEGLCGQIAIAVESTRLRQEMSDRLRELNELQRIMSREGWQVFQAKKETRGRGYRFDRSTVRPVSDPPQDAEEGDRSGTGKRALPATGGLKDVFATPMSIRGEIIGALGIQDDPDNPLDPEDRELLSSISVQVAEALESARLLEQTQRHALEMEAVAQVSAAASTILDARKLLETVTTLTKDRFGLYHVAVFVKELDDKENTHLRLAAGTTSEEGWPQGELQLALSLSDQEAIVAQAAREAEPVLLHDIRMEPGHLAYPLLPGTRSELSIPLIVGDQVLGVLDLQSEVANRFGEDDVRIHSTLASQVAVAYQNAVLYAEQLQTTERLREIDRLKSEFLASMSHELRTPLNSIIGFADVLLEGIDGELTERMEEDVTLIRDSGRHLRELIGEMLDMSKIEAGMMDLRYEEVELAPLAKELVANAKSLASAKEIEIDYELDPHLEVIYADRTRLTQILLNLMSNAVKFTEQGRVTLAFRKRNGDLLASVSDTGIGIKQEDIPVIFEQFRQIDGGLSRKVGGTGLGVPISKRLVELHGGKMWVESEPGLGSTFWFTVPTEKPSGKMETGQLRVTNEELNEV